MGVVEEVGQGNGAWWLFLLLVGGVVRVEIVSHCWSRYGVHSYSDTAIYILNGTVQYSTVIVVQRYSCPLPIDMERRKTQQWHGEYR
jgi:hypothetical protein